MTAIPGTIGLTKYRNMTKSESDDVDLLLYDTIGFGSTDDWYMIIEDILMEIKFKDEINAVIILLKMERKNIETIRGITKFLKLMELYGAQASNLKIYLTHADLYAEDVQENFLKTIKTYIPTKYDIQPEVGCFVNLLEMHSDFKEILKIRKENDINNLITKIKKTTNPFSPGLHISQRNDCIVNCLVNHSNFRKKCNDDCIVENKNNWFKKNCVNACDFEEPCTKKCNMRSEFKDEL